MLHAVYNVTGDVRVAEDDDKDKLIASGLWFDHPNKAKEALEKAKLQIKDDELNVKKPKLEIKNGKHGRR